ncbi:MAG: hypothetical protein Q8M70_05260 [bacterium]|nr:hypothetical protein [bacterium]
MNKGLISGLVLLVIGLVCGALLAGINAFTSPVIQENAMNAKLRILSEFYIVENYDVEVISLTGPIDTVFLLRNKTNTTVIEQVVYSVRARGYQSDIVMLIALNTDLTVDQYKVVSQGDTSGIGDVIIGYDFGMTGQPIANLDAFAGPSPKFTVDAVYACFQLVGARALIDLADFIQPANFTLDSIRYNLDPSSFVQRPFILTVSFSPGNNVVEMYLAIDFSFVALVDESVSVPNDDVLASIKLQAQTMTAVSRRTFFQTFNPENQQLVVKSFGFEGNITVTFQLNGTLDDVLSVVSIQSDESYSDGGFSTYGQAPGFETHILNLFVNKQTINFDAYSGATYTENALSRMINLVNLFLNAGNGGQ